MDYTVHKILQARILEQVAIPFSRGSFQFRDQTLVSCIAGWFFTSWTRREAWFCPTQGIHTGMCCEKHLNQWSCSAAAAAKLLQSFLTLCDLRDGSPPGSRPWDSPGKNTGVGCHFLLQCMKVKSLSHVWLFATPWTAAHQAPLSMGFSRQEYWSGVPLPSPRIILYDPAIPFLSYLPKRTEGRDLSRYLHTYVHSSIIYNTTRWYNSIVHWQMNG